MYIFIVLMLTGVKASGTATLSFVFPAFNEKEVVQEFEEVSGPLIKVDGVVASSDELEINLVSRERIDFVFDVLYDDGSIESYDGGFIDGVKNLEVPVVLSGSRRKVRWVNILWEGDGLVVCNAANEGLPDLSLVSTGQFEKN
jgi:hypothetical protein